eukprot:TRINITY_DN2507_c0_g1_i1.p1 TRINITY_DN2507_c0_g1~~TRINITY_DN2507_c0_g1_i1.p1  ORF type:complete len:310 (+),score=89.20 TRINITY_DN2507_c0_g1_i1:952-1881(+)
MRHRWFSFSKREPTMTHPLPPNFNKETIQLIATDVDGTLLNPDHELTEKTVNALNSLPEHVGFILATGKTRFSTREVFDRVNRLNKMPSIFLNGLYVVNPDGSVKMETKLNPKVALRMYDFSALKSRFVAIYSGDRILASSFGWKQSLADLVDLYHEPTMEKIEHDQLRSDVESGKVAVHKMIFMTETDEAVPIVREELREYFASLEGNKEPVEYDAVQAVPQMLEIVPNGSSKATALEFLCKEYQIDPKNVLTFGDGENDMAMLSYAGCSVAMGNAKEYVKPVAKYVGKPNSEDGLANVLERIFSSSE